VVVPLRPSSEHILIVRAPGAVGHTRFPNLSIHLFPSWEVVWLNPQLRASNEGLPRPRVARAKGAHQATPPSPLTALSPATYNLFTFSCNRLI